jgi:hypothetical protein
MTENEQIRRDKMTPMNPGKNKDPDPPVPLLKEAKEEHNDDDVIDKILGTLPSKAEKQKKRKAPEKDNAKEKKKDGKKKEKKRKDDGKNEACPGVGT